MPRPISYAVFCLKKKNNLINYNNNSYYHFHLLTHRQPPTSTLFPYTTLFRSLKSGVNHTSRGSISTSTLPSIKLRKCSSKIITSILSFISGRLATKSNQIKQLIRNGRSASLQRTFKKSFT